MKDTQKTFLAHLTELRRRLIVILVCNLGAAAACFVWVRPIMERLLQMGSGYNLVYLAPSELLTVYVEVAVVCGVALALPVTLFEVWMFVASGLYRREKIALACTLGFASLFFALGVWFGARVALPFMLAFFLNITMEGIAPMISVAEFLSFVLTFLLSFGVVFEMPVAAGLLTGVGLLRPGAIRRHQPVIILVIFIVAAALTPPDVASQMMMALPMCALLQLSIGVCWVVARRREKRLAARAAQTTT